MFPFPNGSALIFPAELPSLLGCAPIPMQYRPTAAELLTAIAELLEQDVIDALTGPVQHKVRVAANLARILEHEVTLGGANAERERVTIGRLLNIEADGRTPLPELRGALADALRHADLPGHSETDVWDALVAITVDDLAIAKPGHDAWTGDA